MIKRSSTIFSVLLIVGVLLSLTVTWARDWHREPGGDAPFYLHIAESLAAGNGFKLPTGFWPDAPQTGRAPVWPAAVAAFIKIVPFASPIVLMRILASLLNAVNGLLCALLCRRMGASVWSSGLAGFLLIIHPAGIYLGSEGWSENSYVTLLLSGALILLSDGSSKKFMLAGLLLGLSTLVRSNFVLFPFIFAAIMVARKILLKENWQLVPKNFILFSFVFFIPPGLWILRNAAVAGIFPVLSTIEGETLYGGNNFYVESDLGVWGYWVFPDDIPGEPKKRELAKTRTEYELDRMYHDKGMAFIKENPGKMPRLIVGKLIRAYCPVPWVPALDAFLVSLYRIFIYLALVGALIINRRTQPLFNSIAASAVLVNFVTVLIYYGCSRFTYTIEVLAFPIIGQSLDLIVRRVIKRDQD